MNGTALLDRLCHYKLSIAFIFAIYIVGWIFSFAFAPSRSHVSVSGLALGETFDRLNHVMKLHWQRSRGVLQMLQHSSHCLQEIARPILLVEGSGVSRRGQSTSELPGRYGEPQTPSCKESLATG